MEGIMKLFKKALVLSTVAAMIFGLSAITASAETKPTLTIDGTPLTIAADLGAPFIDAANRTQAPIRAVSEGLGAQIAWDQATQTATINGSIKVTVGSSQISTAYGTITMDTTAVNKDGRIYVPIRYVANALGYDIEGKNENGAITANVIKKVDLTISAAASLKEALDEAKALYNAEKPNAALTISYGGSGALQQQIEQGAPVDLFISAAQSNMNALKEKGLLTDSTIKNMLQNKLVLIVPADSKANLTSITDVTKADVKKLALGEPTTVPAGKYATQVYTYYNLIDSLKEKIVYAKDVREVLTWVESGNADAGLVYSTDAKVGGDKIKIVATAAEGSHDPIMYPAAVIKASKHAVAAQDFLNFLTTDTAKAIFVKYGFSVM